MDFYHGLMGSPMYNILAVYHRVAECRQISSTYQEREVILRLFSEPATWKCVRIDSAGNVGIGTTGPGYNLHIKGDGNVVGNGANRL